MDTFTSLLLLYIATGTAIAIYAGKNRTGDSQEQYFIGGRGIHWVVSALTYAATTYSSFMMVGLVGLSFATGIGAMFFELTYLVATVILLSTYGEKIWALARENNLVSPMELFSLRMGKPTAAVGTVVSVVALVPYTAAQVIGLSLIFQNYGISYSTGVLIAAVLICIWSLVGGLRGVAFTDALQGLFMLLAALVVLFWSSQNFGGFEFSTFPNKVWTPSFFINITLPWAFFALTNPQVVQRLFILKEKSDLKKMIILFASVGFVYTLITCFVGFAAKFGLLNGSFAQVAGRDQVTVQIISMMAKGLGVFVALSIVFASVSTSNSIILTLSSMVTRDVVRNTKNMWYGRVFIAVITVFVALFALNKSAYIVELSVATSRILLCFLPLFIDLFHIKKAGHITGIMTIAGGAAFSIAAGKLGLPLSSLWALGGAFFFYSIGLIFDNIVLKKA